jgi:hypothetical protein
MAVARRYSGVMRRPAVLIFAPDRKLVIIVTGCGLGVFAGLRLPVRPDDGGGMQG